VSEKYKDKANGGDPDGTDQKPHKYEDLTKFSFEILKIGRDRITGPENNVSNIIKLFTDEGKIDFEEQDGLSASDQLEMY